MKEILHFFQVFHGIMRAMKGFMNISMNTDNLLKLFYEEKEIALLRAQLNNDSSNSGIPTSRTPIGKKKKIPNTRKKTGRKKGGQKGHPCNQLAKFDDDQIDEYSKRS